MSRGPADVAQFDAWLRDADVIQFRSMRTVFDFNNIMILQMSRQPDNEAAVLHHASTPKPNIQ